MNLVKRGGSAFDQLVNFMAYVAAAAVITLVITDCSEIFMRTFLNASIPASVELQEYLQLLVTFVSAAYTQRLGGHVRLDIVLDRLSSKNRALTNMVTHFFGSIFLMAISGYATYTTYDLWVTGVCRITPLGFPKAPLAAVVALGIFLLAIQFFRDAYKYLNEYRQIVKVKH